MANNRLDDMLEKYGEICTQTTAAKILSVVPRTVSRMVREERLRGVGHRVDVRSIVEYIENPQQKNFEARARKGVATARLKEGDFLAAAKAGRWARRD